MKRNSLIADACAGALMLLLMGCKLQPGASRHGEGDPTKVYRLRLNPAVGSSYAYTIANTSEFQMEVNDKKVDNKSKSTVDLSYKVGRDSSSDLVLDIVYDHIHVYSKNGDTETDLDADKKETTDPVEKLLGSLKGVTIRAAVSPRGEMRPVKGYDEIKRRVMAGFAPGDTYSRTIAEQQWDQRIKQGLLEKNMEQLFRLFPDSAVHVGDTWHMNTVQQEEISLDIGSTYTLQDIKDGVAIVRSLGTIRSNNSTGNLNGYSFTVDLTGEQDGSFEIETSTGMVLHSSIESTIRGEMEMLGKKVPMKIHSTVNMLGRRTK